MKTALLFEFSCFEIVEKDGNPGLEILSLPYSKHYFFFLNFGKLLFYDFDFFLKFKTFNFTV